MLRPFIHLLCGCRIVSLNFVLVHAHASDVRCDSEEGRGAKAVGWVCRQHVLSAGLRAGGSIFFCQLTLLPCDRFCCRSDCGLGLLLLCGVSAGLFCLVAAFLHFQAASYFLCRLSLSRARSLSLPPSATRALCSVLGRSCVCLSRVYGPGRMSITTWQQRQQQIDLTYQSDT